MGQKDNAVMVVVVQERNESNQRIEQDKRSLILSYLISL